MHLILRYIKPHWKQITGGLTLKFVGSIMDLFLPYIDNWATCDGLKPKCINGNEQDFVSKIYEWLSSKHEYTVRFGISMLLSYYLDEYFKEELFPYILENDVKVVVQLGDILDKRRNIDFTISNYLVNTFFKFFNENEVYLYSTLGNHDVYYRQSIQSVRKGLYFCSYFQQSTS